MQPLLVLFMAASTSAMMAPCTPPPGCKNDQKTCFLPMPDSPDICPPAPLCIDAKGKSKQYHNESLIMGPLTFLINLTRGQFHQRFTSSFTRADPKRQTN